MEHHRLPIIDACWKGDKDAVLRIMSKGTEPSFVHNIFGETLLHVVCAQGHLEIAKVLIEKYKCSAATTNKYGNTPLHLACLYGRKDVAEYLIEHHLCNLSCTNKWGETALHISCNQKQAEVAEIIMKKASPAWADECGWTALHYACRYEYVHCIEYLLEKQLYDPSYTDDQGNSALQYIFEEKHTQVRAHFIKKMSSTWCDKRGWTLLHYACWYGHLESVKYLVEDRLLNSSVLDNDGSSPLDYACKYGYFDFAKYLVEDRLLDSSSTDKNGSTPLHCACRYSNFDLVKYLVEDQSCDPSSTDKDGSTSLHYACRYGHFDVIKYLLENQSCDSSSRDKDGNTPLHYACECGDVECVRYLVENVSCDTSIANKHGEIPLHCACKCGDLASVRYLVENASCDTSCANEQGEMALHFACKYVHGDVVSYLLKETNCNVNCATKDGTTPLSLVAPENTHILKELIRYGANPENVYIHYKANLPQNSCSNQPADSAAKVFILGYPGAGKSTLTAALKTKSTGLSRLVNRVTAVPGVEVKTAGIIPHRIQSGTFGHITIYDFAGHEQFYAGHNLFLKNAVSGTTAAIFIVVADLRKSNEEFRETLLFWLAFIQNQYSSPDSTSHIIIVCSHADEVNSKKEKVAVKLRVAESVLTNSVFHFAGLIGINCLRAESSSMTELRQMLTDSCNTLRPKADMSFNCHCFLLYILEKFQHVPGISLSSVLRTVEYESELEQKKLLSFIPDSFSSLCKICDELNQRGNLLFLKNTQDIAKSWIVLDQEALLCKVSGTVFAPEGFKQHQQLATSNTGVVPLSRIAACFHNLDSDLIAQFLCHLEFCREIEDHHLLKPLHASSDLFSPTERFFFFPALVVTEEPKQVWQDIEEFYYHFGWMLRCSKPEDFFLPHFLHVLLLRLAFSFDLTRDKQDLNVSNPVIQGECHVWKNGIYWLNRFGLGVLVEVVDKSRKVNVVVRCLQGVDIECAKLRSAVIAKVLQAVDDYCPGVSVTETFVSPTEAIQHPLNPSDGGLIAAAEVAKAVCLPAPFALNTSYKLVELQKLLLFEAYANFGTVHLATLFTEENEKCKVDAEFFNSIIRLLKLPLDNLQKIFFKASSVESIDTAEHIFPMWCSHSGGTYQCLRQTLDAFSVFAGRNPLKMISCKASSTPAMVCSGVTHKIGLDTPDRFQQCIPKLSELLNFECSNKEKVNISVEVGIKYVEFGSLLLPYDVTGAKVKNMAHRHHHDPEQIVTEILQEWLTGKGKQPVTWSTLVDVLHDIGLTTLADDISKVQYQSSQN